MVGRLGSYLAAPISAPPRFQIALRLAFWAKRQDLFAHWTGGSTICSTDIAWTSQRTCLLKWTRSGASRPLNAPRIVFEGSETEQSSRRLSHLSRKTSTLLM